MFKAVYRVGQTLLTKLLFQLKKAELSQSESSLYVLTQLFVSRTLRLLRFAESMFNEGVPCGSDKTKAIPATLSNEHRPKTEHKVYASLI
jgi:hypothetical protein